MKPPTLPPVTSNTKLEIENEPENLEKLIKVVNFYSTTLSHYNKVLRVLSGLPRTNGAVIIDESCFEVIAEYMEEYDAMQAYAQKILAKDVQIH